MRAVQRGASAGQEIGIGSVNCESCRAQMATDALLNKLRCADCRQIKFDQLFDAGVKAAFFTLGGIFAWLVLRRLES